MSVTQNFSAEVVCLYIYGRLSNSKDRFGGVLNVLELRSKTGKLDSPSVMTSDDIISERVLPCGMVMSASVSRVRVHSCGYPARKTVQRNHDNSITRYQTFKVEVSTIPPVPGLHALSPSHSNSTNNVAQSRDTETERELTSESWQQGDGDVFCLLGDHQRLRPPPEGGGGRDGKVEGANLHTDLLQEIFSRLAGLGGE